MSNLNQACPNCDAEIGYGFCSTCDWEDAKNDFIYSDDEADEVYSRGLTLARSEKKSDALEVWLPLARSGDATTMGAVIATLWLMDRFVEAKTWIVHLAEIDMDALNALAIRLDIPFSEFDLDFTDYDNYTYTPPASQQPPIMESTKRRGFEVY